MVHIKVAENQVINRCHRGNFGVFGKKTNRKRRVKTIVLTSSATVATSEWSFSQDAGRALNNHIQYFSLQVD